MIPYLIQFQFLFLLACCQSLLPTLHSQFNLPNRTRQILLTTIFSSIVHVRFYFLHFFLQSYTSDSYTYIFFFNRICLFPLTTFVFCNLTCPISFSTFYFAILLVRFHFLHFFLQSYLSDSSNYIFFFNRTSPILLTTLVFPV